MWSTGGGSLRMLKELASVFYGCFFFLLDFLFFALGATGDGSFFFKSSFCYEGGSLDILGLISVSSTGTKSFETQVPFTRIGALGNIKG